MAGVSFFCGRGAGIDTLGFRVDCEQQDDRRSVKHTVEAPPPPIEGAR